MSRLQTSVPVTWHAAALQQLAEVAAPPATVPPSAAALPSALAVLAVALQPVAACA